MGHHYRQTNAVRITGLTHPIVHPDTQALPGIPTPFEGLSHGTVPLGHSRVIHTLGGVPWLAPPSWRTDETCWRKDPLLGCPMDPPKGANNVSPISIFPAKCLLNPEAPPHQAGNPWSPGTYRSPIMVYISHSIHHADIAICSSPNTASEWVARSPYTCSMLQKTGCPIGLIRSMNLGTGSVSFGPAQRYCFP